MAASPVEQITAAYEEEKRNRRPPRTADDLPFAYEDITPEWLSLVLAGKHPGARVVSLRLDTADDGNSNRRRLFLEWNGAGREAGMPDRVFCKATHGLANRIALGHCDALQAEVDFYNTGRPLLDIEAPSALFARYNKALNSIIIMRELPEGTTFCTHTTDITRSRVEDQMRVLAQLHGRFLESPALKTTLSIFQTAQEFFGKLDYPDFEKACDKGFEIAKDVIPARVFARRAEIWPATRKSVEHHAQLPHTLIHGDVHLRNWYITPDGRMGLADWQSATRGHWARDVIYALVTSLTIENRRAWLPELLRYYHEHLQQAAGRSLPFAQLEHEVRCQLMTVLAFWTITINPAPGMPDMQPRDSTVEFIRRISAAMDDLDSLDSFD